jgi:hypothetical protein
VVCGSEQICERVSLNASQSHKHDGVVYVVIREVVGFGSFGEQIGSLIEGNPNGQRVRLDGLVDRHAREHVPVHFQGRRTVCRAIFCALQFEADGADGVKRYGFSVFAHHPRHNVNSAIAGGV